MTTRALALMLLLVSSQALAYDITARWHPPEYDVDGNPIDAPMIYQVYGSRNGETFRAMGQPTEETEQTTSGIGPGCFELYVTAKFYDSVESAPSDTVEHCTTEVEDEQIRRGIPLPPVILDVISEHWRNRWTR